MKRKLAWAIPASLVGLFLILSVLRETGVLTLNNYSLSSQSVATSEWNCPRQVMGARLSFIPESDLPQGVPELPDDGAPPVIHKGSRDFVAVAQYRLKEKLTWRRWIPFFKSGTNELELDYRLYSVGAGSNVVPEGGSALGEGYIRSRVWQRVTGFCSARNYGQIMTESLLKEMRENVTKKIAFYPPYDPTILASGGDSR